MITDLRKAKNYFHCVKKARIIIKENLLKNKEGLR
jgi:hypothetical protein